MLFLSSSEQAEWERLAGEVLAEGAAPGRYDRAVRSNLAGMFRFFVGSRLANAGLSGPARSWFAAGALEEGDGLFMNAFVTSFLERQKGRFAMAAAPFEDPAPFVHFAGVPVFRSAREHFLRQAADSLPDFSRPLRFMDVGCGNGALGAALVAKLLESGKVREIGEILQIDPSPAMSRLAEKTVGEILPHAPVRSRTCRIQEIAGSLERHVDVALCSLSFHHLTWEEKVRHLSSLGRRIDHLLIFELDANHDTPELHSPELAASVYQTYGRVIDAVFAHDAPLEVAVACVDRFLMTEAMSLMTQPRGERADYHMLRRQWHELCECALGEGFDCRCDATAYADDFEDLFTLHYGR